MIASRRSRCMPAGPINARWSWVAREEIESKRSLKPIDHGRRMVFHRQRLDPVPSNAGTGCQIW